MTQGEMIERVRFYSKLRGLSKHTEEMYVVKATVFQRHYGKPATELGLADIQNFLYYLLTEKKLCQGQSIPIKDRSRCKEMTLSALEFMRRFLIHILPTGFTKIRHYGFLSNRNRTERLKHCKILTNTPHSGTAGTICSGTVTETDRKRYLEMSGLRYV